MVICMSVKLVLGKTATELLPLSWVMKFHDEKNAEGKHIHRETLLDVPKQIVLQWGGEIRKYWKDINLVVSAGDAEEISPGGLFRNCIAQSKHISKRSPRTDIKLRLVALPEKQEAALNQDNEIAGRTVWLTTYETFTERYPWTERHYQPQKSFEPKQHNRYGKEVFQPLEIQEQKYKTVWGDVLKGLICDKAHSIRSTETYSHILLKQLGNEVVP